MKRLHAVGLITVLVACDQLSKAILHYRSIQTTQGAFLNSNPSLLKGLLTLGGLAVVIYLTKKTVSKDTSKYLQIALVCIFAGGVSNMVDLLVVQKVIDPFHIHYVFFNLADLYIVFGVGLVIKLFLKHNNNL